jgi:hypothetical protein
MLASILMTRPLPSAISTSVALRRDGGGVGVSNGAEL